MPTITFLGPYFSGDNFNTKISGTIYYWPKKRLGRPFFFCFRGSITYFNPIFLDRKFLWPYIFLGAHFFTKHFLTRKQCSWPKLCFGPKKIRTSRFVKWFRYFPSKNATAKAMGFDTIKIKLLWPIMGGDLA